MISYKLLIKRRVLQTYKLQLMIITTHYGIDEVTRSFDLTICSSYYCFSEHLNPDQMSSEQLVVPYLDDITSQVMKITPGYIQQDIFHNNLVVENISRIHKVFRTCILLTKQMAM